MYIPIDFIENIDGELLAGMFFVVVMVAIILLPIFITFYILGSLGTSKIAKKMEIENPWMAWIPYCSQFLLGNIAFNKNVGFVYLGLTILNSFNPIESLKTIIGLGTFILSVVIYHKIYEKLSKNAVVMTVFTALSGGLLAPVFLFAIRNNELN